MAAVLFDWTQVQALMKAGFAIVPVEPSEAMVLKVIDQLDGNDFGLEPHELQEALRAYIALTASKGE